MSELAHKVRNGVLVALLVLETVVFAVIATLDVPRLVSRPIIVVASILAVVELMRIAEGALKTWGPEGVREPSNRSGDQAGYEFDIWHHIGHSFTGIGVFGMVVYFLICVLCVLSFALSITVQTAADAAANPLLSQTEASMSATVSLAVLLVTVRTVFVPRLGWPFD